MAGELRKIRINEIVNYYENPRHEIATTEKDTLKKLFESVGNHYMLNLAEDIANHGLLGNQQVVVVYSDEIEKYVVYEGNRRVAAIKMLISPSEFDFLDKSTRIKVEKMAEQLVVPNKEMLCYVTDEKEAFFIMERIHSGEDKGRGLKAWNAREKEAFRARQDDKKSISYLIDFYVKKYCDNFDITTIMPFTTIQRIFANREIKRRVGLDIADETTFTDEKMKLVVSVIKAVEESAKEVGIPTTRLYNRARDIEDKVLPIIDACRSREIKRDIPQVIKPEQSSRQEISVLHLPKVEVKNIIQDNQKESTTEKSSLINIGSANGNSVVVEPHQVSIGGSKNLPYFFMGIDYSHLNPNDVDTHGIAEICKELQYFSERKLVDKLPIATVFLIRSAIEQSIIYYSKKHCIQGQNKLIWNNIENISKLSKIIENYNKNLPNYITDVGMRQYFTALFGDYEKNVEPDSGHGAGGEYSEPQQLL